LINKTLLQKRFSENAPTYDQFAQVQKKMAQMLTDSIETSPQRILEIGCGTGYMTERLCRLFPHAEISAVDFAPGMLEVARKRLQGRQVEFICGDIEEMKAFGGPFDLIISNAAFQWFNQLENTIHRLFLSLAPGGSMHFSTFGESTFCELHTSFKRATQHAGVEAPAPGQSFFTLIELIALCQRAVGLIGNGYVNGKEELEIETFANVRDFFYSIKKIGATNSNTTKYSQRPSLLKNMMRFYEQDFRKDDQVMATYHCLYVSIQRRG